MVKSSVLYLLFFLSGISGLIYQVVWVREFGQLFGNTVHSATLVISVFMCGLGVGSYLIGKLADRKYRVHHGTGLLLYSYSEIGIACCGLVIALVLPFLETFSATISAYQLGGQGWSELTLSSYVFRDGIAIVMLTPVTMLMGGTLTLLIRFLVRTEFSAAGWRIGLLYGLNTAGAALGCFLVDFVVIPNWGLFSAQLLAVLFNLCAGYGAFVLWRGIPQDGRPPVRAAVTQHQEVEGKGGGLVKLLVLAVFFAGFAAMGLEILWFRYLTSALGQFRVVFSLLLTIILLGIWLGSVVAGYLSKRYGQPVFFFIASQIALVISSIVTFLGFKDAYLFSTEVALEYIGIFGGLNLFIEYWLILRAILLLVGFPAFFMGFSFPLANAIAQKEELHVGQRAGLLYLGNTLGAVCGALTVGFLTLPSLGMKWSGSILYAAALVVQLLLLIVLRIQHDQRTGRSYIIPVLVIGFCLNLSGLIVWSNVPRNYLVMKSLRNPINASAVETVSEGILESIVIKRGPGPVKVLYTNGHPMSGTDKTSQRYMRAFTHIPLLHLSEPRTVLVICFGVGTTLHSASLHSSIQNLEVVDLSKHVLEQAAHFSDTNGNILNDPRVSVFVNDGRQHLRMQPAHKYDLITLEPPPIAFAGVSALYSTEFYELVKRCLKQGGFLTQWLPINQLPAEIIQSMIRSFIDVFPEVVLLAGTQKDLFLMGRKDTAITLDPQLVLNTLKANPVVQQDLNNIKLGTLTEIVGMFVANGTTLRNAVKSSLPVTDNHPLTEYGNIMFESELPASLFDNSKVNTWCVDCFQQGQPIPEVQDLYFYLKIMDSLYTHENYLKVTSWQKPEAFKQILVLDERTHQAYERTLKHNPYLSEICKTGNSSESE